MTYLGRSGWKSGSFRVSGDGVGDGRCLFQDVLSVPWNKVEGVSVGFIGRTGRRRKTLETLGDGGRLFVFTVYLRGCGAEVRDSTLSGRRAPTMVSVLLSVRNERVETEYFRCTNRPTND